MQQSTGLGSYDAYDEEILNAWGHRMLSLWMCEQFRRTLQPRCRQGVVGGAVGCSGNAGGSDAVRGVNTPSTGRWTCGGCILPEVAKEKV